MHLSATDICAAACLLQGLLMFEKMKLEWLSNIRGDLLAGIVVALALIPEAIAFSIVNKTFLSFIFNGLFSC